MEPERKRRWMDLMQQCKGRVFFWDMNAYKPSPLLVSVSCVSIKVADYFITCAEYI